MNICKICGSLIDGVKALRVCPACAIGSVLQGNWDYLQPPLDIPSRPFSPLFNRLPLREDFFEKYQILEAIENGGQGQVWKVWDYEFRRVLAMKGLNEDLAADESTCYRFLAEAQITSQLKHPGILPVYDAGLDFEGKPFYTTELSSGLRLDRKWSELKKDRWTKPALNASLGLIVRVCEIMGHVHSRGVIHRDLKPSNVLVGEFGDVRIIDWGSAAILKNRSGTLEEPFIGLEPSYVHTDRQEMLAQRPNLATALGGWPSTLIFTPPELLAGKMDQLGPETDIYAVGVMLYELLTGQLPYVVRDSEPDDKIKLRILLHPPTPVLAINPTQSRDLAAIAERAMARDKNSRYSSMKEMADDIRAAVELRPVKARNPNALLITQRFIQRHYAVAILIGFILVVATISFATVRGLEAQRRASRQIQALESAELARRSGHWREVLQHLDEAESAGYSDPVSLGLKRAEAWTVLNEPSRSKAELEKLANYTGKQRGIVRLRTGEHYLYDAQTAPQGIEFVTQALNFGLDPADEAFAKGLLAQTANEALDFFRQALILDPYHYGAHIRTLGLEYLLGLRQDLESESRVFEALYPDDPSPMYIKVFNASADGRFKYAQATLNLLKDRTQPDVLRQLDAARRQIDVMAQYFDCDRFLKSVQTLSNAAPFEISPIFPSSDLTGLSGSVYSIRMPYLPCVAQGLIEAYTGVRSLKVPLLSEPAGAFQRIKSAHVRYPEALAPFLGGILLKRTKHLKPGDDQIINSMAAELFEMAANSSSIFSTVPRLARFMAAQTEFDLAKSPTPKGEAAAKACLKNIEKACAKGGCSAPELSAYLDFACSLKSYDLARALLVQWESVEPEDYSVLQRRIELEIAIGPLSEAQSRLAKILSRNPDDPWALAQKASILQNIKKTAAAAR
jgi:serine/threonine protein kinase